MSASKKWGYYPKRPRGSHRGQLSDIRRGQQDVIAGSESVNTNVVTLSSNFNTFSETMDTVAASLNSYACAVHENTTEVSAILATITTQNQTSETNITDLLEDLNIKSNQTQQSIIKYIGKYIVICKIRKNAF